MSAEVFEQRRWLGRVRSSDATDEMAVGAAFAIDKRHLVTCAHVVMKAAEGGPGSRVAVELLFDGGRRCLATVLVEGWQPEPVGNEPISQGDVAILRIPDEETDLTPLPLTLRNPPTGSEVMAYGFPEGHQESNIAQGLIGPPVGLAWRRIEQPTSALLDHGFSGGALWSTALEAAIGMVVFRDEDNIRAAYALPIAAITAPSPLATAALHGSPLVWLDHAPTGLRDLMVDRRHRIEELTRHFIGRASVFRAIDARLGDPGFTRGYIFIAGEPGIGKSSIVARLADARGWPHHFNVLTAGQRSPAHFLGNICAQLVLRYELGRSTLPSNVGENATVLIQLLREAVERGPKPVVLLIDALDEAERPVETGMNRLFLPSYEDLPEGCYIIATTRLHEPVLVSAWTGQPDIPILEDAPENMRDIQDYVGAALDRAPAAASSLILSWRTDRDALIRDIANKSEGNFMYVRYVLHDLLEGSGDTARSLAESLDSLPQGLVQYYQRHWQQMDMQDKDRFRNLLAPIVFFMAAAGDSVLANDVAAWINAHEEFAGTTAHDVSDVLEGRWAQFVQTDGREPPAYRLYHRSFLEFLERRDEMRRYRTLLAETLDVQLADDVAELPPLR